MQSISGSLTTTSSINVVVLSQLKLMRNLDTPSFEYETFSR